MATPAARRWGQPGDPRHEPHERNHRTLGYLSSTIPASPAQGDFRFLASLSFPGLGLLLKLASRLEELAARFGPNSKCFPSLDPTSHAKHF